MKLLLIFLIGLSFYPISSLKASVVDFKIHEEFMSPRAMGMGGAFSAVADDHSALFFNPAGLARRTDGRMNLYLIKAEVGGDLNTLQAALNENSEKENPADAIGDLLASLYGTTYHTRVAPLGGFWVRPNWGVALLPADFSSDIYIRQQLGPQVNLVVHGDTTFIFGWGQDFDWFGPHQFSLGASLKALHRFYYEGSYMTVDLASNTDLIRPSDMSEGLAVDTDIGTLFTPELPAHGIFSWLHYAKPTFSFVVRNALDYGYVANFHLASPESSSPPNLGRRIDIGSAWDYPPFWKLFRARGTMDIRNIGHKNWSFIKGFHLGAELQWEVTDWFKGGYTVGLNQGYLTAGFIGHFLWFHLDLVTYGEEVGTSAVRDENRIYALKMSMDF